MAKLKLIICNILINLGFLLSKNTTKTTSPVFSGKGVANENIHNNNIANTETKIEYDHKRGIIQNETTLLFFTNRLFKSSPPLDFDFDGVTSGCRKDSIVYLNELKMRTFWALQMYDSSAKIPTGLLTANVNQYGNFDECLQVKSTENEIRGKYCLTQIQVDTAKSPYLSKIINLMHAYYIVRSTLDDPPYPMGRFSSINWALCVPQTCTETDVELLLRRIVSEIPKGQLSADVKVDKYMCAVGHGWKMPWSSIFVSFLFVMYAVYIIAVTLYDIICRPTEESAYLQFSLKRNFISLGSTQQSAEGIPTVHGVRFINTILLWFVHKLLSKMSAPYINRTYIAELSSEPWAIFGHIGVLYTDTFLMLSGMLTTCWMLWQFNTYKSINVFREYQLRLIRIVPPLAATVLFYTFIYPWIGNGPMWHQFVTRNADLCKESWWKTFLFIHNYWGFEKMCMMHSHHIGVDMQLFFATPIFVAILWRFKNMGVLIIAGLATVSTIMRYHVTYTMELDFLGRFEQPLSQLYKTADNSYTLPTHRATVYLIGVLLGYLLKHNSSMRLTKLQLKIGHVVATVLFLSSLIVPWFATDRNYKYQRQHAALFAAFNPITWCLSFAWIIFYSQLGCTNFLTKLFSWPGFIVFTRMSYAINLIQFLVFYYNLGRVRTAESFTILKVFDLNEIAVILFASLILTLLFDSPFQKLIRYWFNKQNLMKKSTTINEKLVDKRK